MKKVITAFAIVIFTPLILCCGIYLFMVWQYQSTYMNGVMINGIYAEGMTPEEINDLLVEKTEAATFSVVDKSGEKIDIPVADMDYTYSYMDDLNRILDKQDSLMWGINLIYGTVQSETIEPVGSCDTEQLKAYLFDLDLVKKQADPKKLRLSVHRKGISWLTKRRIS